MTAIDLVIIGAAAIFAIWGYFRGAIVSGLALGGFAGGTVLGARVAPHVLGDGASSPYAPLFALVVAVAVGALAAIVLEGIGSAIRGVVARGPLRVLDELAGALLGAGLALGIAWILGAVALQTPQLREFRLDVQRSVVLKELNTRLPPSGPILKALARFDPLPEIEGPAAEVAPPNSAVLATRGVKDAAASVVRVLGTACGLGVQGSGWVASENLVVTNAHVVAGQADTTVQLGTEGASVSASAVHFDSRNDLALLKTQPLARPVLNLSTEASSGDRIAILGYPENGPYHAEAGRLGSTNTVLSQDAYGRGPLQRSITSFRGQVLHGNSGGPAVGSDGRVVTTVFAASQSSDEGFGVPDEVVRRALAKNSKKEVSTGPCTG